MRLPARCEQCGGGLLHELVRVRVETDDGTWTLCATCAAAVLARLENAHVEAGVLLEQAWRLGEAGA